MQRRFTLGLLVKLQFNRTPNERVKVAIMNSPFEKRLI